ncbi:MAG TPA: flagellar hook-basal body complex protein [Castellaniella sp.]|jgi:flagellar hook protein FlgE|nr:flagellar hook-basal body complex protein [Castellaniella sp.]
MGFGQGLSGLNAAAQNLDVIGNNIANSGTVGFKAGSATFADVYASSRVGLGVQVASINQRFTTGTVSSTGNQFDMAIDGANGLFVVKDPSGQSLYTRNGQFVADKNNNIVNTQGQQLMGYAPGGTTLIGLTVPTGNINPQATNSITNTVNLDANAAVIPGTTVTEQVGSVNLGGTDYYYKVSGGTYTWYTTNAGTTPGGVPPDGTYSTGAPAGNVTIASGVPSGAIPTGGTNVAYVAPVTAVPFDPSDAKSFSNMTPVTVYDSLGNAHTVQQYYTKREPTGTNSVWEVNYVVDGTYDPANTVQLQFDQAGRLAAGSPTFGTINYTPGGGSSPAAPMAIKVAYDGSTQFGGSFSQNFIQDGYSTGEYASMSIGTDGSMVANYTNGVTKVVGTLALANFNNLQGLQPMGGNAWAETANSGQPILGIPGSNGLALIKGQAVEESNVDMSQELVNMIIAQRTYQANAQTIKTQDQVLQTLINMS